MSSVYGVFACRRSGQHFFHSWLAQKLVLGGCSVLYHEAARKIDTQRREYIYEGPSAGPLRTIRGYEDPSGKKIESMMPHHDVNIIVVRSVYNVLASRYFMKRYLDKRTDFFDLWLAHATFPHPHVRVFYDKFVVDQSEVAKELSLPEGEVDIDSVPWFGGGSTFDNQSKKGSEMKVLERWKSLPPEILAQVPEECADLNERLFGWRP